MRADVKEALIAELTADIGKTETELRRQKDLLAYLEGRPADPVPAGRTAPAAPRRRSDTRTAKDFALKVLSAGGTYGPADVVRDAKLLGWATESEYPNSIMRHVLRTLAEEGRVERLDGGRYRFPDSVRAVWGESMADGNIAKSVEVLTDIDQVNAWLMHPDGAPTRPVAFAPRTEEAG